MERLTVEFHDDRFRLSHALPDGWREQLRARGLPRPIWVPADRANVYDEEPDQIRALRFLRDGYRVHFDDDGNARLDALIQTHNLRLTEQRDKELLASLRPYQQEGVEFITAHKRVLLADAMGLGKTVQALMAVETLGALPLLVVAPASVKLGWQREVLKWTPWRSCQVVMSSRDEIDEVDVLVVNPELLAPMADKLESMHFGALVMDEAHYFKNPKAQRTRFVQKLAEPVDVRIALTGTPIPNRREDIIQQLELLGQLDAVMAPYRGVMPHYWQPGIAPLRHSHYKVGLERLPSNVIHKRLRDVCMIRRTKHDVAKDLPTFQRVRREMPAGNIHAYRKAERKFLSWVDTMRSRDDARLGSETLAGRRHLADLRREAALSKIGAVVEWADEMREGGERVLFYAHHRAVVAQLAASLPGKVASITGETNPHTRRVLVDSFNEFDFLVASMDAMGQGVDGLQHHANHVAFVELDWTPTKHEQCEGRLHRIGQTEPVTAWYFTAADTIEGAMLRRIDAKWKDVEGIVDGRIADKFVTDVVTGLMAGEEDP